ncbi:DUF3604 domain-containing protein [Pseudoteredinibacter isoporae]|uniref:DUF3604 domain-containing protein n=1 Tax=Pseudoteredinibacter isoporae TaxID=570281 RepID=A0A7X0MXJ9_9GAMM|nr:DUF3604 domain-containing protein [Pseudoteredinibacter isoporae]MBB6521027.1 hypothetical protein [Pseudoteredinibacter isoporae]NHO86591.1 DUF3604 domain-containing protein [Pseudoteredinibacter isoporae]NIB24957.1 DUF3604 domain-containing protein [Pseudoteredinibacter isoporae]
MFGVKNITLLMFGAVFVSSLVSAEEQSYSPYVQPNYPDNVYFGDTHLHTVNSFDAGALGARIDPAGAYRFAQGEEITSASGQRVKLKRPLDFLVVADHSDELGFFPQLLSGSPKMLADKTGRRWYEAFTEGGKKGLEASMESILMQIGGTFPKALQSRPGSHGFDSTWKQNAKAADEANDPGRFTALIGYEWTLQPGGNNVHRNVIYRDGADVALQTSPFTTAGAGGSDDPRDLWKWMSEHEKKTGGKVLAIPHNGNLSNGLMFPEVEPATGKPISKAYAETRMRWEPIVEVTQIKGDGEAHPLLSPNDEFADYGTWDHGNLNLSADKIDDMLLYEYARSALKIGLKIESEIGANPYKFGLIGATDSHTGMATAAENNFFGKHSLMEPHAGRPEHIVGQFGQKKVFGWQQVAGGLAAVWAKENTREAIFDAMMRKDVYATTGPRMIVRMFGGWSFSTGDEKRSNLAEFAYQHGVSMGGDLYRTKQGKSPRFIVTASKDPDSGNLDRIQIVKGWVDRDGASHERVYNVAWSGNRTLNSEGKLAPVGNTVDISKAAWSNTIGEAELSTTWEDPDFRSDQRAFYYARVLEIPTPSWVLYDAIRFQTPLPKSVAKTTQERAYTSPIWYTPGTP